MRLSSGLAVTITSVAVVLGLLPANAALAAGGTVNCGTSGAFSIDANGIVTGSTSCVGSVTIPASVTEIANGAFERSHVSSLTFETGSRTTRIGSSAFDWNPTLTSLSLPNSLTTIGSAAFRGSTLTSLVIPNSVTSMADSAFSDAPLTSLTIGTGLSTLSQQVFTHARLQSVVIPSNITAINYGAFQWGHLSSVTIPSSVTTIGERAFESNNLASVDLGTGVAAIGPGAFGDNGITAFTAAGNAHVSIRDGAVYNSSGTQLLAYPPAGPESVTLPGTVTSLSAGAFMGTSVRSVTLPSHLTSIPSQLFDGASHLRTISIPGDVVSIGDSAFRGTAITSISIPDSVTTIGSSAFAQAPLTRLALGAGLTRIGTQAFIQTRLTSVTIPDGVTRIDYGAFEWNSLLTWVSLPSDLQSIESNAFEQDPLTTVSYCGNSPSTVSALSVPVPIACTTTTPPDPAANAPSTDVRVTSSGDCALAVSWDAITPTPETYIVSVQSQEGWISSSTNTDLSLTMSGISAGWTKVNLYTNPGWNFVGSTSVYVPHGASHYCQVSGAQVSDLRASFDWATNIHVTWNSAVASAGEDPITGYNWCVDAGNQGRWCGNTSVPGFDLDVSSWSARTEPLSVLVWATNLVGASWNFTSTPVSAFVNTRPNSPIYLNPNSGPMYSMDMQTGAVSGPLSDTFPADGPGAFDVDAASTHAYFVSTQSPPRLYTLDLATGHYEGTSYSLPAAACRGVDLGPDGFLWAACTSAETGSSIILRINLQTHVAAQIGDAGSFSAAGLATDPLTNQLWAYGDWGQSASIDRTTGAWTDGPTFSRRNDRGTVDFSSIGDRYFWTHDGYYGLIIRDHLNGTEHSIRPSGVITDMNFESMAVPTAYSQAITDSPLDPRTPELSAPTSTATGFTAQVTNFNQDWSWSVDATNGATATMSASGLVTVAGLPEGWTSKVTVTNTRAGYLRGTGSVSGSAQADFAPLTPNFDTCTASGHGFTVQVSNFDPAWSWAVSATNGGSASIDSNGLIAVGGLSSGSAAVATATSSRSGYTSGEASVMCSALAPAAPPVSSGDSGSSRPVFTPGPAAKPESTPQPPENHMPAEDTHGGQKAASHAIVPSRLSTNALASMTSQDVERLSAGMIAALSPEQIAMLAPRSLRTLSRAQFRALSVRQFAALTPRQVAALPPAVFADVNRQMLAALHPAAARRLTVEQIKRIPTDSVWGISQKAYAHMTWLQQQAMKRAAGMVR